MLLVVKLGNFTQRVQNVFSFSTFRTRKFGRLFHLKRTVPFFCIKIYYIHWLPHLYRPCLLILSNL